MSIENKILSNSPFSPIGGTQTVSQRTLSGVRTDRGLPVRRVVAAGGDRYVVGACRPVSVQRMPLRQLKTLIAVAEQGSLRKRQRPFSSRRRRRQPTDEGPGEASSGRRCSIATNARPSSLRCGYALVPRARSVSKAYAGIIGTLAERLRTARRDRHHRRGADDDDRADRKDGQKALAGYPCWFAHSDRPWPVLRTAAAGRPGFLDAAILSWPANLYGHLTGASAPKKPDRDCAARRARRRRLRLAATTTRSSASTAAPGLASARGVARGAQDRVRESMELEYARIDRHDGALRAGRLHRPAALRAAAAHA